MTYKSPKYKKLSGFDASNYPEIRAADDRSIKARQILDGAKNMVDRADTGTPEYKKALTQYKKAQVAFEKTLKDYDAAQQSARTDFINEKTKGKQKATKSKAESQIAESNKKLQILQDQKARAIDLGQDTAEIDVQIQKETKNQASLSASTKPSVSSQSIYEEEKKSKTTPGASVTTPGAPVTKVTKPVGEYSKSKPSTKGVKTSFDGSEITKENLSKFVVLVQGNWELQEDIRKRLISAGLLSESQSKSYDQWAGTLGQYLSDAMSLGFSLEDYIAKKTVTKGAGASGQEKVNSEQLQQFSNDNNLKLDKAAIDNYTNIINSGAKSLDDIKLELRTTRVAPMFPAWEDQIKAGTDINTLAYPYMYQLAQTLEIPLSSISMDDPRILKAMQAVDSKGKPTYMPVWQFEKEVAQKDPTWQYTNNAWRAAESKFGEALKIMGLGNVSGFDKSGSAQKLGAKRFYSRMLSSFGGAELDAKTMKAIDDAPNAAVVVEAIRESDWYKKSFPAMNTYRKGHPEGDEASYKTQEANYKYILRSNDFPPDFYDSTEDIASLMEKDIDVSDFKSRVEKAMELAAKQDPETQAALKEYSPALASKGAIASYFLDPNVSLTALNNLVTQITLGGISKAAGVGLSKDYAMELAKGIGSDYSGYNLGQTKTAIESAGVIAPGAENLASLEGEILTPDEIVKGTLDKATAEGKKLSRLASQQRAAFGGSGAGTEALNKGIAGSF